MRSATATRLSRRLSKYDWNAYLFIGPALIIFLLVTLYPVIDSFRISFYDWDGLNPMEYVGLGNYRAMFEDEYFINSLKITLIWTVTTTVCTLLLGSAIAVLCGLTKRNTTFFRTVIYACFGISAAATGMIWLGFYQPQFGMLNAILRGVGLSSLQRSWMGVPLRALFCIIVASVWQSTGFAMITMYGAIKAIPGALFEAGYIDGVNSWQITRYIMLPLSMNAFKIAFFITVLGSLKAFALVLAMTQGGPMRGTEILGYYMYRESFRHFRLGYGAAVVIALFLSVLVVAVPLMVERSKKA
jgi:raffinose/stachyose/melibiose transport system permease protein